MNDKLRNPNWKRPDNWKYEEDWGSPAWNERMEVVMKRINERREKEGFSLCPNCKTQHTSKTLMCRECGLRI